MVEFLNPPIGMSVSQYIDLVKLWKVCNSCVGFCISLGKLFFSEGVREVDEEGISPRATIIWDITLVLTSGW